MTKLEKMELYKDLFCADAPYCAEIPQFCKKEKCEKLQRKWPTPEQFKEEYGVEYSDNSPVWVVLDGCKKWLLCSYNVAKGDDSIDHIVCACTPYGKPDVGWRPE